MKKILIFDISNICYRSQFAITPLFVDTFGEVTAIFGGLKSINKIGRDLFDDWSYVISCFDSPVSHRKSISSTYKHKRTSHDPEKIEAKKKFYRQMDFMYTITQFLGFSPIKQEGFEADDLIAQVCKDHPDDIKFIVSNDEDLYQLLVDPNVHIYRAEKGSYTDVTKESFVQQYGIEPNEWAKVKAIAGCESDNVIGIEGIGEKRAIQFLQDKLSVKLRSKVLESEELINENLKLVTLPYTEKPIAKIDYVDFNFNDQYFEKLCEVMKFNSFKINDWKAVWK